MTRTLIQEKQKERERESRSNLVYDEVTNERMKTAKGTKEGIGCFRFENSRFD